MSVVHQAFGEPPPRKLTRPVLVFVRFEKPFLVTQREKKDSGYY